MNQSNQSRRLAISPKLIYSIISGMISGRLQPVSMDANLDLADAYGMAWHGMARHLSHTQQHQLYV